MPVNHATRTAATARFATFAAIATVAILCACAPSKSADATDSATSIAGSGGGSDTSHAAASTPAGATGADTSITVTSVGFGPLRIGMTVANAAVALNSPAPSMAGLDTACAYAHIANAPAGMRVMVTHGTVARIEIDSSSIATGLGARVGDAEGRIQQLYGSRVTVQPHKYLPNGHYLVVSSTSTADSALKLVFETDGARVTKYRAGRVPEVEWVEGCS